jgi:uncharacterized membrane protein
MKNKLLLLTILILSFIPVIALFHSGLPITHDGQDHVARIANFYQNLSEGNLIPRWAPNLNWGYGHPILEFLYPLPSYIASAFHFVGLTFVDSTKIVFAGGMILSFVFMYLWLLGFSSKQAALFGATLYTYAPYRFVEVYVRGDIGENLAFAFIPLVLYFIYQLFKKSNIKFLTLGSISLALLILAHNAISLMFVPLILVYGFWLLYLSKNRKKFFIYFSSLVVLGFGLASFFWIPALLEGKYTLRNIVTKGGYLNNFVNFNSLIYGPWSYGGSGVFSVQFGLFQWISIFFSPFIIYKFKKNKEKLFLSITLLIFTILGIFIMLPDSSFIWSRILILQNFQFPWRFLAIIVFTTATLGALLIDSFSGKINSKLVYVSILIILVISSFYWNPKDYLEKSESFYSGVYYSTTDTGESSPIWSIRGMEHTPQSPAQVIEGTGRIKEVVHKSTYRQYQFDSQTGARILVNILYFPNWTIFVDGKILPIQFQDPAYRGLITFNIEKGDHKIEAVFKDTNLRILAEIISFVSLCLIMGFYLVRFVKTKFS